MISFRIRTRFIPTLKQNTVYYLQEQDDNLPHVGSQSQIGSKYLTITMTLYSYSCYTSKV